MVKLVSVAAQRLSEMAKAPRPNATSAPSRPTKRGGAAPASASPILVDRDAGLGRRRFERRRVSAARPKRGFHNRRRRSPQSQRARDRAAIAAWRRRDSGSFARSTRAETPLTPQHLGQIADEAVRDVHAAAGETRQHRRQRQARLAAAGSDRGGSRDVRGASEGSSAPAQPAGRARRRRSRR